MGLFENLLKGAAKAIDDTVKKNSGENAGLTDLLHQAMGQKDQMLGGNKTSSGNPAYANPPAAKPSVEVKDVFYDEGDIEVEFSFMLSEDFVPLRSHAAELDFSAIYYPDCDEDRLNVTYSSDKPCFCVASAADNEIYNMVASFKEKGTAPADAMLFEKVSDLDEKIYFRAKINRMGSILYFYGMDRGIMWTNCYIGVDYRSDVVGTALEKRLMEEVDKAVRTYKETKL